MDICRISATTWDNTVSKIVKRFCTEIQSTQFQNCVDDLEMTTKIMEHLKGVPVEAIYIAPNILQKMKNNPSICNYYMTKLDGFVGEYKRCHRPGILEMSFSITEDGQYCTSADPTYLDSMYEDERTSKVDTIRKKIKFLEETVGIQPLEQISDPNVLSYIAGIALLDKERIKFYDTLE